MPSIECFFDSYLLVLDATCTTHIQGGIVRNGEWTAFFESHQTALEGLFQELALIFKKIPLEEIKGFIFGDGPGSTLGLRISATVLRTWMSLREEASPLYQYHSLELAAASLEYASAQTLGTFRILSPSRQKHYHCLVKEKSSPPYHYQALHEITEPAILTEPCFFLPQAKLWTLPKAIANLPSLTYSIKSLPKLLAIAPFLFKESPEAQAFRYVKEEDQYVRWEAKPHKKN